ncbi:MAG: cytochrome P450, partial [Ketobacteraceae bacterium]|nr:cytochrome P450 [Ketobacteraceae bacterium]
LPEKDFKQIKGWCVVILDSQNGVQRGGELAESHAAALAFLRYCWRHYLKAKQKPARNLMGIFVRAAGNPTTDFDDQRAVSAIFQLLIAGSDSSATTMGNAIKMLVENPDIQNQLRQDFSLIPAFIEEVFRLESAFQGHFRWVKHATRFRGVHLPAGTRVFLMWASGNRDERFFEDPDTLILNRKNGKKHLTFGHGVHACLGRELARLEIRVLLEEVLDKTCELTVTGDTPYIASMFARTLVQLPLTFQTEPAPGV